MTLKEYLQQSAEPLARTVEAIADAVREIAGKIRTADVGVAGSQNSFAEEQLKLDILADNIIFTALEKSGTVVTASSEERAEEVQLNKEGTYAVAFDPLDGSSLVDVNLAVGTIFGVWEGTKLIGHTGAEMKAAGYAIYGPRTVLVITLGGAPSEFTLNPNSMEQGEEWVRTRTKLQIGEGKMFAPGNLRACASNEKYRELVDFWIRERYTLRYSGAMVPDVHQILTKGHGIFSYPGSSDAPAKLRLLYECAPLAKIVEAAGGSSSDGTQSILAKKIESLDERIPICLGSKKEVARFEKFLG